MLITELTSWLLWRTKVSILGVLALWGDCKDIPTDQGSKRSVNLRGKFWCLQISQKTNQIFEGFLL